MKLAICLIAIFIAVASAQCIPPNGGAAANVIGAPDFVTSTGGVGANQVFFPADVKTDFFSRKVFVVDAGNSRVLRFPSAAAFLNGQASEASFGGAGCTATGLNSPLAVAIYPNPATGVSTCYFADTFNHRVVRLTGCATAASGAAFDGVFGQTTFTLCASNPGVMSFPSGVTLDVSGNLYISDFSPLIYRFLSAQTKVNGAPADAFFGIAGTFACSANSFGEPTGMWVDPFTGVLFVADTACNRVLGFNNALAKPNSSPADIAIGQPSLVSGVAGCGAGSLTSPNDVNYDQVSNSLFVADSGNNRVVVFPNAITAGAVTAGLTATAVIGQLTLTTCGISVASASSLLNPTGVFYDAFPPTPNFDLFVADQNNSRVLRYQCAASTSNSNSLTVSGTNSVSGSGSNSNSGSVTNTASNSNSNSGSNSKSTSVSNSVTNSWTPSTSPSNSQTPTSTSSSTPSRTPVFCGNGILNANEQCDPGVGKFGGATCCNTACQFKSSKAKCGPKPVTCKTQARCELDITTGQVFCRASKPRKAGKFCKTASISSGACDGHGTCVAKP